MQAIAPAAAGHQAAGELIDDDDLRTLLTLLHHIVLVAVIKMVGAQGRVQVMHQRDVGRVVQGCTFGNQAQVEQDALGVFVTLLGQENLVRFFIQREVTRLGDAFAGARVGFAFLLCQKRHHLVHGDVHLGVVFGLAADDEGRARLVDQDRIHLVDDGVVQAALHAVRDFVDHVVAQVVKAVFVVGAVGDVGVVGRLLFLARHIRQVDADRQTQEVVELAHPARIAVGQVIIDRHHMHALAGQCVEVNRQRGRQRLALTRAHFRNLAVMQRHAAQHLHIEVAHLHDAFAAFADYRKSFGKDRIKRFARGNTSLELLGFGAQLPVVELFILRLQRIDALHGFAVTFKPKILVRMLEAINARPPCSSRELATRPKSLIEYGLRYGRLSQVQLCAKPSILPLRCRLFWAGQLRSLRRRV